MTPKIAPEKPKPSRHPFALTVHGLVDAETLEEAHQKLDFALNSAEWRGRGITILRFNPDVRSPVYGMFNF